MGPLMHILLCMIYKYWGILDNPLYLVDVDPLIIVVLICFVFFKAEIISFKERWVSVRIIHFKSA